MTTQLRALIVEDQEDDALLLVRELQNAAYDVVSRRVDTAEAFQRALNDEPWDIVLCDYMMPHFSGTAALRMLRESGLDLPFIFVSGAIGEDTAVAAMKAGAHDYIMKDNLKRLAPAVRRELLDAVERRQHRAAEMQLKMSEHKYRHLFQSMREAALLVAEGSGKVIDANTQAEVLFDRARDELLGTAIAVLCPADGRDAAAAPGGLPPAGPSSIRRRNGTLVPVDISVSSVELHGRSLVLTLFRDISERRRAETSLRNVLRHARTLLIHAVVRGSTEPAGNPPDAGGLEWEWRFQDEETARAVLPLKVGPDESYGDAWAACLHPDDRADYLRAAEESLRAQAAGWQREFRCVDQAGSLHWFIQVASVQALGPGQWSVTTINTDITERKLAEEALAWKTAFLEAQVESARDGIVVVDRQRRKLLQNQRLIELWKIPPEVAQNEDDAVQVAYAMTRTKDPQAFAEKVAYLYAHPEMVSQDEIELDDGTILDRQSWPVRDKAGNHYGRIWTFRDLTDRRRLEEQYRQAQKMEAIGQLAGGIAHDFNNMLTVVQMHASLLLEETGQGPMAEELRQVLEACERASSLTRQLLTFSRRQQREPRWLDLGEVIGSMLKLLRRVVGEEIAIEAVFAPNLPLIHADPGMMEQVLMNLVLNARDAMPGGGRLTVSLDSLDLPARRIPSHTGAPAGRFVRLCVTDTGIGISADVLPRIFDPFFTTKAVGQGTGLGLATVFGIVDQHQGWIEVRSTPGLGTTFQVYLPAPPAPAASGAVGTAAPSARSGGNESILLVEDDAAVRSIAASALRQRGYTVLEAGSAAEAHAVYDGVEGAVDLLLTDLVLPDGVSGLMLAEELRRRRPGLATIYTSGYSPDVLSGRLRLKEGMTYLPKPYSFVDLAALVRRQIDHARSAGGSRRAGDGGTGA